MSRRVVLIFSLLIVPCAIIAAIYAKAAFAATPPTGAPAPASPVSPATAPATDAPSPARPVLARVPAVPATPVCGLAWNIALNNPSSSDLYTISAISANDVWAVGTFNSISYQPTIMHWDGQTWS